MKYRYLGKAGIQGSELSFGSWVLRPSNEIDGIFAQRCATKLATVDQLLLWASVASHRWPPNGQGWPFARLSGH